MTVTAILPVPARYGQGRGAVFAAVAGRSPLARIVGALQAAGADVVVAAAAELVDPVREALAADGFPMHVVAAESPGQQAQCVTAGLTTVPGGNAVVLHHIEWPIVATAVVERILAALSSGATVVVPVRPVTDSVKAVDDRGAVTATLDRAELRNAQYPRGYDRDVLAGLAKQWAPELFDDLAAATAAAQPVTLVDGDDEALSVELPRDADYLAAFIEVVADPPAH